MQLSWKVGRSFHSFEYVQGSAENFPDCEESKLSPTRGGRRLLGRQAVLHLV